MNEKHMFFDLIPPGSFYSELTNEQKSAIKLGIQLGRKIKELFPEIAEDYRNGLSVLKIVNKYKIKESFGVKDGVAGKAVHCAIGGYDGSFLIAEEGAYNGLIADRAEYEKIAKKISIESVRKSGLEQKKAGIGIHSQSPEEKIRVGRLGVTAIGRIPFTDEECKFIYELAQKPEFQRRTRIHAIKITEEVNKRFHNGEKIRTTNSIKRAFIRARKYKKENLSFAKKST